MHGQALPINFIIRLVIENSNPPPAANPRIACADLTDSSDSNVVLSAGFLYKNLEKERTEDICLICSQYERGEE